MKTFCNKLAVFFNIKFRFEEHEEFEKIVSRIFGYSENISTFKGQRIFLLAWFMFFEKSVLQKKQNGK